MECKCYKCGKEFEGTRTEEEAVAEKVKYFGDVPIEQFEIICDECWKAYDFTIISERLTVFFGERINPE